MYFLKSCVSTLTILCRDIHDFDNVAHGDVWYASELSLRIHENMVTRIFTIMRQGQWFL
jgi:hypothetical protein